MKFINILHLAHEELRDPTDLISIEVFHKLFVECPRYSIHFRTSDTIWVLKQAFLQHSLATFLGLTTH